MEVYLDNSATTKAYDTVKDIVVKMLVDDYGNPSSKHLKGVEAERAVDEAKKIIAKTLKVQEKEIYFTSGGTESNNLALIGAAQANHRSGRHIITSKVEHSSVINTAKELEERGYQVTYLPVDGNGVVLLDKLEEALTPDTILISIMHVNNEIGTVEPIEKICGMVRKKKPETIIHVDAVQSFGKFRIAPKRIGIDLLSVSAHKIHGPKGAGFLYINHDIKIKPMIFGGFQQNGIRSGTENVPGIAGTGEAVRRIYGDMEKEVAKLYELKENFIRQLSVLDGVVMNTKNEDCFAPHIISAGFKGIKSEVLLHSLEERGIYVSSGSACNANKNTFSGTLQAIGVPRELLDCTVRFSLNGQNTKEELDYCIDVLKELLPKLRLYRKR